MNLRNIKTIITGRLSKQQRQQYIEEMEKKISNWSYIDQYKYEYSKDFVSNLHSIKTEDGDLIQLGPVDKKILEYFVFAILYDYDRAVNES